ncbi:Putative hydrolase [Hoyosella subflava DQS3-9A1]|uniref:Putative hydrolase n=2 Tax=Hoyosella TaxID=697025 RepID=F6EKL3_HOYSD|nr:Putative hydrolase [Hoyosella subflava DQS3-9A1]
MPAPFRINIRQDQIDDLNDRLARTRWPDDLPGSGWKYGVPGWYLKELADYWLSSYDWRTHEAQLNEHPQYLAEIDGQQIHFMHIRSPESDALPLLLIHGWPSSIVDFAAMISPLTSPRTHGAAPSDAFHLVIPSLPGFGFSGPTRNQGEASTSNYAAVLKKLMKQLGYDRYGAHGGDLGSLVAPELGRIDTGHVVGVHMNGPLTVPAWDADPAMFPEEEQEPLAQLMSWAEGEGSGYAAIQGDRPQNIAYGLVDSPAAQLAWITEHFRNLTDPAKELPEDAVNKDQLLTNVSIYWFTATAGSSARIYKESTDWGEPKESSGVPTGAAIFPGDVTLRSILERENNVVHWSRFERGGHFAAMEAPDLLTEDIQAFFRPLRSCAHSARQPGLSTGDGTH